jgi:broad specificity polyphosphatase/5'/3'-nucleotidase SurE
VVSGINRGYNLAYSVYLAGTVGRRARGDHGVPAIAASLSEAARRATSWPPPRRCSAWRGA